jgi:hypothetical protein
MERLPFSSIAWDVLRSMVQRDHNNARLLPQGKIFILTGVHALRNSRGQALRFLQLAEKFRKH